MRNMISDQERFEKRTEPELNTGCILWIGTPNRAGYGRFDINQVTHMAHRASWILKHGAIPEGLKVCHRCDTPACVNPDHLFLGTDADNLADMRAKGRAAVGESHGSAKLTALQVQEIRALYAGSGLSQQKIADRYGVTQTIIGDIVRGRRWRSVPSTAPVLSRTGLV